MTTYLTRELFDHRPQWTEPIPATYDWPVDLMEGIGIGFGESHPEEPEIRHSFKYEDGERSEVKAVIDFFNTKKGRYDYFWAPTWHSDLVVTEAFADSAVTLIIEDVKYLDTYFDGDVTGRHIFILFPDGTSACRKIIAAPTSTTITLDSAVGVAVSEGDLGGVLISFLLFSRFDMDEVEVKYHNIDAASIAIKLKAIPSEAFTTTTTTSTTTTTTTTTTTSTTSTTTTTSATTTTSTTTTTTTSISTTTTTVGPNVLLEDDFTGTVLDTGIWTPYVNPQASVTQDDVLELNNINDISGCGVESIDTFSKDDILTFSCKWKTHKTHYAGRPIATIWFYKATETSRDAGSSFVNKNCFGLQLGYTSDAANRTRLYIVERNSATTVNLITYVSIDIDETLWHDVEITINGNTRLVTIDFNSGTYHFSGTITQSVWDDIGDLLRLQISASDRNRTNTESFDDVLLIGE